jgi:hypothetical protein
MKKLKQIFDNELTLGSDKWDPYFRIYEKHFHKFIGKSPTVVEVGVQGGGSIQMWKKYFGEGAKIIGIDIDSKIMSHVPYYEDGIKLVIGDQGNPNFWDQFLIENPKIDVFIDDGGHTMHQQKLTFLKVFPHITEQGVFLCEDTHTCYDIPTTVGAGIYNPDNFIEFSKRVVEVLHYNFIHDSEKSRVDNNLIQICKGLQSVSYYNSVVVFEKDEEQEYKRVFAQRKV